MMLLESVCVDHPAPVICHGGVTLSRDARLHYSLHLLSRWVGPQLIVMTAWPGELGRLFTTHHSPGPSSPSPWVFNSMFWSSCAQHPRSCLHFVSDICMLGSCQSRCSSHLTIGRSDGPRLNICQNFLQRHFCGDGSSLWHSLHNIAPSVTSFYQSARHGGRPADRPHPPSLGC